MTTNVCVAPKWDTAALQAELPRHVLTGSMRYSDFQPLGHGGKAEVFRCLDSTLGRSVAFKVLHHRLMSSTAEQQMLAREARIMASLDHRAIPVVHDLGRDRHARPYFTMTLVPGRTLDEILSGLRRGDQEVRTLFQLEELVNLVLNAGETLHYAHVQGVVHGDVKPHNLIVDGSQSVRLIDWGLASFVEGSHGGDFGRGRQGSPLYMSPEQITGEQAPNLASDIYSLGVVLYECLALQTPMRGKTLQEVLQKVKESEPELPSMLAPDRDIPAKLECTCMRALAKSPQDRYHSMSEFCELLKDCHLDLLINYDRT